MPRLLLFLPVTTGSGTSAKWNVTPGAHRLPPLGPHSLPAVAPLKGAVPFQTFLSNPPFSSIYSFLDFCQNFSMKQLVSVWQFFFLKGLYFGKYTSSVSLTFNVAWRSNAAASFCKRWREERYQSLCQRSQVCLHPYTVPQSSFSCSVWLRLYLGCQIACPGHLCILDVQGILRRKCFSDSPSPPRQLPHPLQQSWCLPPLRGPWVTGDGHRTPSKQTAFLSCLQAFFFF